MGWFMGAAIILTLQILIAPKISCVPISRDFFAGEEQPFVDDNKILLSEQEKLDQLNRLLTDILLQPWPEGVTPLVYIEDALENSIQPDNGELGQIPFKRSRYYRRYPWKRQNQKYDPENRYMCQPSKEDVFRLLVALHEARQGSRGQTVNFCNRKRPASVVFTNIRFLG